MKGQGKVKAKEEAKVKSKLKGSFCCAGTGRGGKEEQGYFSFFGSFFFFFILFLCLSLFLLSFSPSLSLSTSPSGGRGPIVSAAVPHDSVSLPFTNAYIILPPSPLNRGGGRSRRRSIYFYILSLFSFSCIREYTVVSPRKRMDHPRRSGTIVSAAVSRDSVRIPAFPICLYHTSSSSSEPRGRKEQEKKYLFLLFLVFYFFFSFSFSCMHLHSLHCIACICIAPHAVACVRMAALYTPRKRSFLLAFFNNIRHIPINPAVFRGISGVRGGTNFAQWDKILEKDKNIIYNSEGLRLGDIQPAILF